MKIPEALLEKWLALKSYGDGKKIAEESDNGVNDMDVSRALAKGECSDRVFEAIAKYFKSKEEKINAYL